MDLKELLGEELYNQVIGKVGDKHKLAVVSDGNWFPKEKFDEVNTAKKQAESDLKERDKQLETLSKSAGDSEQLQAQIKKLQDDNKDATDKYTKDLEELRLNTALKLDFGADVHDVEYAISQIDKSIVKLNDDGSIKSGFAEQKEALRTSKPFIFVEKQDGEPKFKGAKPPEGSTNKTGGQVNPWKKETFNLTEQGKLLRENPDLAKQLQAAAK
ncbi:Phage minor structural protein GP20 [compost metagenome]